MSPDKVNEPGTDEKDVYCICQKPYVDGEFMIECGKCNEWFHGSCVGIEEYQAQDIDIYVCPKCQPVHGPLVYSFLDVRCENGELVEEVKRRRNVRRHNYKEIHDGTKQITAGTVMFVRQLKARKFSEPTDDVLLRLKDGSNFNVDFLHNNGFDRPIIINNKKGLGIVTPPSNFTIYDVEKRVGSMQELHVIDVARQEDLRMKMREWTEYYNSPVRGKVLNVISLEFSNTSLAELVEAPEVARNISWVENAWPKNNSDEGPHTKPIVSKYCLMSVKDCYTDFHVDFGGTSVWYHVLRGEKVFYFIEPTEENLLKYSQWVSSSDQGQVFFGEKVNKCYKLHVEKGSTLFLPTGWIHAVLTPKDSLVFGGNFLHTFNIGGQQRIYRLEKSLQTPLKFLFPNFETTNWFAARAILKRMKDIHQAGFKLPPFLAQGVCDMLTALRSWTSRKDEYVKYHKLQIPLEINPQRLIKSLDKELKCDDKMKSGKEFSTDLLPSPANLSERIALNKNILRVKLNRGSTRSGDESSSGLESPEKAEHSKGLERLKRKREKLKKREKKLKEELENKKSLPSIKLNVHSDGSVVKKEDSDMDEEPLDVLRVAYDDDDADYDDDDNGRGGIKPGATIKLKLSLQNKASYSKDMKHYSSTEGLSSQDESTLYKGRNKQPVAPRFRKKNTPTDIKTEKDIFTKSAGQNRSDGNELYFKPVERDNDCAIKPIAFSHSRDFPTTVDGKINPDIDIMVSDNDTADDDGKEECDYDNNDEGGYVFDYIPKPKVKANKKKRRQSDSDSDYLPDDDEDDDNYYEDADFVYPRIDVDSKLEEDDFSWNPNQRKRQKRVKKRKNRLNSKLSDDSKDEVDPFFAPDDTITFKDKSKSDPTSESNQQSLDESSSKSGVPRPVVKQRKKSTAKQRLGKLLKLDKTGSRYMRR